MRFIMKSLNQLYISYKKNYCINMYNKLYHINHLVLMYKRQEKKKYTLLDEIIPSIFYLVKMSKHIECEKSKNCVFYNPFLINGTIKL